MIQSGLKAILIKVAGIGLATRHLGKSLEEMQSNLLDLVSHHLRESFHYLRLYSMQGMAPMYVVKEANMNP